MRLRPPSAGTVALLGLALLCTPRLASAAPSPAAPSTAAHDRDRGDHRRSPYTFAVIGDIPYGATQLEQFPQVVSQINADPRVRLVAHLGDIKSGSTECTDAYFAQIRKEFDRFADPLVYTPGDNEWTDCHRANNGGYNPLERLDAVRATFFDRPGVTLGRAVRVTSQAREGYEENVRFQRAGVSFGVPHLVGSNDSLAPWTGNTAPTPEQTAEVLGRTAAAVELIRDTFAAARADHDRAVVIMTQADMFDPTVGTPSYADYFAFTPVVKALAQESRAFRGPVYLFNGDSHTYNSDHPLGYDAQGKVSPWVSFYGLGRPVENLRRLTVDGSDNNDDYLRVTIQPRGREVLTAERVPYTS